MGEFSVERAKANGKVVTENEIGSECEVPIVCWCHDASGIECGVVVKLRTGHQYRLLDEVRNLPPAADEAELSFDEWWAQLKPYEKQFLKQYRREDGDDAPGPSGVQCEVEGCTADAPSHYDGEWLCDEHAKKETDPPAADEGVRRPIREVLDAIWEAGGSAWDDVQDPDAFIAELRGRLAKPEPAADEHAPADTCLWSENQDGIWQTACGHAFETMTDTPYENGFVFCCYCGKGLVELPYREPESSAADEHVVAVWFNPDGRVGGTRNITMAEVPSCERNWTNMVFLKFRNRAVVAYKPEGGEWVEVVAKRYSCFEVARDRFMEIRSERDAARHELAEFKERFAEIQSTAEASLGIHTEQEFKRGLEEIAALCQLTEAKPDDAGNKQRQRHMAEAGITDLPGDATSLSPLHGGCGKPDGAGDRWMSYGEYQKVRNQLSALKSLWERGKDALEAIVTRCDEGDSRTNWRPIIKGIALAALPDAVEAAEGGE